ncbi:MAG: hypothetical protein IJZ29_02640 [Clostridia bacterium]|nr:hypothetical protein [Clostridia bacterium]
MLQSFVDTNNFNIYGIIIIIAVAIFALFILFAIKFKKNKKVIEKKENEFIQRDTEIEAVLDEQEQILKEQELALEDLNNFEFEDKKFSKLDELREKGKQNRAMKRRRNGSSKD